MKIAVFEGIFTIFFLKMPRNSGNPCSKYENCRFRGHFTKILYFTCPQIREIHVRNMKIAVFEGIFKKYKKIHKILSFAVKP